MSKFGNAKKILSLVLGLMSSSTFGISARAKNEKINSMSSRSVKGNDLRKKNLRKKNLRKMKRSSKKSAGASKKMRKRALSANDIRTKRGKEARGNFFVDKDGRIKPLNTFGAIGGVGFLGLGVSELSKNGAVSKSKVKGNKIEVDNVDVPKVKGNKIEVDNVDVPKVSDKGRNISDPVKVKELTSSAWGIEKNEKKGNKKFAAGRLAQNIKLAFPGYFTEDVLMMSSSKFELYLLCRIVKDTLGEGEDRLLSYKPGTRCRISADSKSGRSVSFGVSPADGYKFSWRIEGDYSRVPGHIAPEGTSNMSTVGLLGRLTGNGTDIAAKMYGGIDCAVFGQFFKYTLERFLCGGEYCNFYYDILVRQYEIISQKDLSMVLKILVNAHDRNLSYMDLKEMMYKEVEVRTKHWWGTNVGKENVMLAPEEELKKEGFEDCCMKDLRRALCLMDLFMNVRLLGSFVSAGANGGGYSKKVPQAGIAVPALYVLANEFDGVNLGRNGFGDGYLGEIWASVKDKLPNYGIGKLLDTNNL